MTTQPANDIPFAMQTIWGSHALTAAPQRLNATVIALGNFDGVHLGHQALLATARAHATNPLACGVLTFDPHPARFFAPTLAPPMIMSLQTRLAHFQQLGMAFTLVEDFNAELAALTPRAFVREYLHQRLGVAHVVVGYDFAFGKGRKGTTSDLTSLGQALGIGVTVLAPVAVNGLVCSSTKIREFVLEGRVEGAAMLLGRPFALEGIVVKGAQRGRLLGYPTANIAVETELVPKTGVYSAWARVPHADGEQRVAAAVSVGTNPTFQSAGTTSVEAYLLDFSGDLYGQRLGLDFIARLRDEQRFNGVEALVAQIDNDVARTRDLLSNRRAKL